MLEVVAYGVSISCAVIAMAVLIYVLARAWVCVRALKALEKLILETTTKFVVLIRLLDKDIERCEARISDYESRQSKP